jgi:type IV pilus assembly protein PilB
MQQGQLEEFDRKSNSGGTNGQEQISLVDRLLELGLITQDQLNVALKEQTSSKEGEDVTTILLRMGFVGEKTLASLLSSLTNTKDFDLKSMIIDQSLVKMIPKEFALANKIIAVDANETTVFVATVDIFNILIADQLKRFLP